jgi:hypothetical protein
MSSARETPLLSIPFSRRVRTGPPHVVILGAGASVAAWEAWGRDGPKPLLTRELFQIPGVQEQFSEAGFGSHNDDFESVYSDLAATPRTEQYAAKIQRLVREYFDRLSLPELPTLFDLLILALRPKDVIASFNWDPYLYQAFRRCARAFNYRDVFPEIHFLHGNVRVGVCNVCKARGWSDQVCSKCSEPLEPVPLLFPVKKYDTPFNWSEWNMVYEELSRAYFLTVFGYAAPDADVLAKRLLLDGWKENSQRDLAQMEIVNIEDEQTSLGKWDDFIVRDHVGCCRTMEHSWLFRFPRRSCDALFAATMRCSPWEQNPFPQFSSLAALWEWVGPLMELEEEAAPSDVRE